MEQKCLLAIQRKPTSSPGQSASWGLCPIASWPLESHQIAFLLIFPEGTRQSTTASPPPSLRWWTEIRNQVLITSHQTTGWVQLQTADPLSPQTPESLYSPVSHNPFQISSSRIRVATLFGTQHPGDLLELVCYLNPLFPIPFPPACFLCVNAPFCSCTPVLHTRQGCYGSHMTQFGPRTFLLGVTGM